MTSPYGAGKGKKVKTRLLVLITAGIALLVSTLACDTFSLPVGRTPGSDSSLMGTATPGGPVCSQAAQPGTSATVDEMSIMVNAVVRPADGTVHTGSATNPTPAAGSEYVMVVLSVTCARAGDCTLAPAENFYLLDSRGVLHEPRPGIAGVPGLLGEIVFPAGVTTYGALFFEVQRAEQQLWLVYENPASTTEACMVVPAIGQVTAAAPDFTSPLSTVAPPALTTTPAAVGLSTPAAIWPTSTPLPAASPLRPTATPTPRATTPSSPLATPARPAATITPGSPLPTSTPRVTPTQIVLMPPSGGPPGGPAGLCVLGGVGVLLGVVAWLWRKGQESRQA